MPWKGSRNPYHIWLSEIILQQTRVAQGTAYFNRFIERFPAITDLANANDEEVFKMWEGLGYYNRCRNLLHAARKVRDEFNGIFPKSYEDIIGLKGIGPYSAAAISSFAYDFPIAVVDGNVLRVLARYFGIREQIDTREALQMVNEKAAILLDMQEPAAYNQAIMDLGATVCRPKIPLCDICPLQQKCFAFKHELQAVLPLKKPKLKKRNRYFIYVALQYKDNFLVQKRGSGDVWENLWQFITIETDEMFTKEQLLKVPKIREYLQPGHAQVTSQLLKTQQLTHQTIHGQILCLPIQNKIKLAGFTWKKAEEISKLAFPGLLRPWILHQLSTL